MSSKTRTGAARAPSRWRLALGLALGVTVALLCAICGRAEPKGARVHLPAKNARSDADDERQGRAGAPLRAPTPAERAPDPEPVIDAILVEKSEVCAGEENLITVQAHTLNGTDEHLHYRIGGNPGQRVPLRVYVPDDGPPEPRLVTVFGRNGALKNAEIPYFRVKDCGKVPFVLVQPHLRPNRTDEYDFEGRLFNAPLEFEIARAHWDFGDGAREVTERPFARHSYAERAQDAYYSEVLVTLELVGRDGRRLKGRTALELTNRAYEVRAERGIVLISVELTPRFPELGRDGKVHQRVRLYHRERGAVRVTRVAVERAYMGGVGASPANTLAPETALGAAEIPPGRGLEVELTLDPASEPDVLAHTYLIDGSYDDLRAQGTFSVMRPPEPPTRERHEPVSEALKQKILRAQRILQKELITAEEIAALEREGAFRDLPRPSAAAESDPERPTNLPK